MDVNKLNQLLLDHFPNQDFDDTPTSQRRDFWIMKRFDECEEEQVVSWLKDNLPKQVKIKYPPIQEPPGTSGRPLTHYRLRFVSSEWPDELKNDLILDDIFSRPAIILS